MLPSKTHSPRLFPTLAVVTACLALGLVVLGAVVRVTGSGLGCGDDWPLCNGTIIPPLDNATAWIEWSHRLVAMSIGVFGLAMLVTVFRTYRDNRLAVVATFLAAVLYAIQSGIGRSVVKADLSPTLVAFHLGTAVLLLAALIVAATAALHQPRRRYARDSVTTLTFVSVALALVVILLGAMVRGAGATLACGDWPLCNGQVLPFSQGQLATIHMIHRFVVLALGVSLAMLTWRVVRYRPDRSVGWLAALALIAYLFQVGVGAMFVVSRAGGAWGAAHVGLATAIWALLVVLSVLEALNTRAVFEERTESQWKPRSEPLSH
jgi:heme A synthase